MSSTEFLEQYRDAVTALPVSAAAGCPHNLGADEERIFTTLLPQAAAIKRRRPELKTGELIEAVKRYSVNEIDQVLSASNR